MRILHCIPNLAGGGAERQLCYLASALSERGHDVHVVCVPQGPNVSLLTDSGCHLHRLAPRHAYDLGIVKTIYSLASALKPDIIQSWLLQMDVVGGICAKLLGIPHVLSERSSAGAYHFTLKTAARISVGSAATAIVANSGVGLLYWSRYNKSPFNTVIQNGIKPPPDFLGTDAASPPLELQADIIFAGRYHEDKNILRLTEAVIRFLGTHSQFTANFFGDGPLRPRMEALVAKHALASRLVIRDYTGNIREIMHRAKVFVNVSLYEGNPNAVLEAALEGVPLVLSDIPSHNELFSREQAILVDPQDELAIANGIEQCLGDPVAALERAARARTIAARYTVDRMVTSYEDVYRDIVQRRYSK